MKKGQEHSEESKDKIRNARLKKDENGYSVWNAKISIAMKLLWAKRKAEKMKPVFEKEYTDLG